MRGLAENRRFILNNQRSLVRGVVGLHASFTVSDETIREAAGMCRDLGVAMHVHLAEDRADVEDARRRGYSGPLERLDHFGALPPGSILAHGVHLTADQVRRADDLGCWLVQNPRSNRTNAVGYPGYLRHSAHVALGTDGFVSDMRIETAALAVEIAVHGEPPEETARRAAGGVALAAQLWRGCDGRSADTIVGACEIVDDRVSRVSRDGRDLVKDGTLQTADVEVIRADARNAAASLWQRMARL